MAVKAYKQEQVYKHLWKQNGESNRVNSKGAVCIFEGNSGRL